MDLFFWRKNHIIDTFANGLADELYSQVQPQLAEDFFQGKKTRKENIKKNNKSRAKVENALNETIKQVNYFRQVNSLGIYGKARLHLSFTRRLKTLGYTNELANQINEILLLKTP